MSQEKDQISPVILRRRFILERLRSEGHVLADEIRDAGVKLDFPTGPQSLKDDLEFLRLLLDINVIPERTPRGIAYFDRSSVNTSAKEVRARHNEAGKLAMAWIAGSLALGAKVGERYVAGNKTTKDETSHYHLPCPSQILEHMHAQPGSEAVISKLRLWMAQITRRICVDSGSTVDAFCENVLAGFKVPSIDNIINHLEVCTNSRSVFSVLGKSSVNARTIMIGGSQEPKTETVCGHLAEVFLENSGLRFGMTFIGATFVDIRQNCVGADYLRDGAMKAMMLDRSAIRVLIADSEKFMENSYRASYKFSAFSKDAFDILITDRHPCSENNTALNGGSSIEDKEALALFRQSGVIVLAAEELLDGNQSLLSRAVEHVAGRRSNAQLEASE